jgi:hypothetical protein
MGDDLHRGLAWATPDLRVRTVFSLPPDPPQSTASSTAEEVLNAKPSTNDDYDDMKEIRPTDREE